MLTKYCVCSTLGLIYGAAWLPATLFIGYFMGLAKDTFGDYRVATVCVGVCSIVGVLLHAWSTFLHKRAERAAKQGSGATATATDVPAATETGVAVVATS